MPGPDAADFGTVVGMRVIAALALVLLLSACVPTSPDPTPTPTPAVTPVFASEEEALAAAEEAYAAYVALADQIFAEGGAAPERLADVATGSFLEASVEGFREVERDGWRSTGGTTFRRFELQSYRADVASGALTAYVCEDVSAVDVLDSNGISVVSPTRPASTTLQVVFDLTERGFLVSGREAWSNEPC